MPKKSKRIYVWLAVDRVRNEVVDFEVSTNRDFEPYFYLARRIEEKYKVEISCSDNYNVYGKYMIADKHYYTESETALVESKNSLIRHYLVRFNRKTKRYSKDLDMVYFSAYAI